MHQGLELQGCGEIDLNLRYEMRETRPKKQEARNGIREARGETREAREKSQMLILVCEVASACSLWREIFTKEKDLKPIGLQVSGHYIRGIIPYLF